jgi:hypothetical protein
MLNVIKDGVRIIIDVRELIKAGIHPRNDIIQYIKEAEKGTMIEIHLPHPAPPLTAALEDIGIECVLNELSPGHFRLLALKL